MTQQTGLDIVLAEDSAVLRDGLVALLGRRGHRVLAAVADGDVLVTEIQRLASEGRLPDVVIADIRMPPSHTDEGLHAALRLRQEHPNLGVLLFSQYVQTRYVSRLLSGGAEGIGYLLKDRVAEVGDFMDALRRVAAGQTVLDPEVVSQLLGARQAGAVLSALTAREREVLELMAQGVSNGGIAAQLHLSYGAVEKNVAAIFTKFDLPPDAAAHRRVVAVLRYLGMTGG